MISYHDISMDGSDRGYVNLRKRRAGWWIIDGVVLGQSPGNGGIWWAWVGMANTREFFRWVMAR